MIDENVYKLILRIIALFLLMIGGLIAVLCFSIWFKANKNLIKAKIFLNESFLKKCWLYMFTGMTFFGLDQVLVLFFGNYSEISVIAEFFKVIFTAMIVLLLIDYYKLLKPCA